LLGSGSVRRSVLRRRGGRRGKKWRGFFSVFAVLLDRREVGLGGARGGGDEKEVEDADDESRDSLRREGVWSHDRVCGRVCLATKSGIFLSKPGEEGERNGKPLSSSRAGEKGEGVRVGEEAKECIEPSSAPLLPSENAR
jgi:hypothetical protein